MTPTEAIINIRVAAAFFAGFGITRKDEEQREEFRSLNAMILDAVAALETQLIPGSVVLPEDLDEIRIRLQNIHGTGLAVMREDAEAIAQQLGLSWEVGPPAEPVIITEHPQPRVDGVPLSPRDALRAAEAGGTLRRIADPEPPFIQIHDSSEVVIDTDAIHRKLDEVRSKLGVEDTEAFRKLLPPRS